MRKAVEILDLKIEDWSVCAQLKVTSLFISAWQRLLGWIDLTVDVEQPHAISDTILLSRLDRTHVMQKIQGSSTMQQKMSQIKASPYGWPYDACLFPSNTALVVIDMQRDCTRL